MVIGETRHSNFDKLLRITAYGMRIYLIYQAKENVNVNLDDYLLNKLASRKCYGYDQFNKPSVMTPHR